jgi:hypothetical protein
MQYIILLYIYYNNIYIYYCLYIIGYQDIPIISPSWSDLSDTCGHPAGLGGVQAPTRRAALPADSFDDLLGGLPAMLIQGLQW